MLSVLKHAISTYKNERATLLARASRFTPRPVPSLGYITTLFGLALNILCFAFLILVNNMMVEKQLLKSFKTLFAAASSFAKITTRSILADPKLFKKQTH